MANTLTTVHALKKPAYRDPRWDVPGNENLDSIDGLLPPKGGTEDQVLAKNSATDNDYKWMTQTGGGGGGGLAWEVVSIDTSAVDGAGYLVDCSAAIKTITLPATPSEGDTVGIDDFTGSSGTYKIIVSRNGSNIMGLAENFEINEDEYACVLVYSDATEGWVITSATQVCAGNPVIANKPLLHVQDQKATSTEGGTSTLGNNDRVLNTILTNEIAGASLASNLITLPAGIYYIAGTTTTRDSVLIRSRTYIKDSSDNVLLTGSNSGGYYNIQNPVEGIITLTATTEIKVTSYSSAGETTNGLGVALGQAPHEVYTDIRIWRLDQETHTPVVALPPNTVVAGVPVTGNIMGLEYQMDSVTPLTTVTVSPGSTMDDTLVEELILTVDTDITLVTPTINTIYHLFITKDTGTVGIEYSTDIDFAAFTGDYKRWIGFVTTDASGNIIPFEVIGDLLIFTDRLKTIFVSANIPTTFTQSSIAALVPVTRVDEVKISCYDTSTENVRVHISQDGTRITGAISAATGTGPVESVPGTFKEGWYLKAVTTAYDAGNIFVRSALLKR